jgi:hypothetical protein
MNRLPASTGWVWLKQGFALFRKQPGLLTLLVVVNILIALLTMPLQPVGGVIFTLLLPSLNMMTFETCRLLAAGEKLSSAALFSGFQKGNIGPLARLGVVYLGISIAMSVIMRLGVDAEVVAKAYELAQKTKQPIMLPASQIYAFLGIMFAFAFSMITLCFAPPLIHWKKMRTFKAIFYSVFAVFGSIGPLLFMFFTWFSILLSIMMIGLTIMGQNSLGIIALVWVQLIMTAILQCTLYVVYCHLLPDTD